jgi:hypothetical protein
MTGEKVKSIINIYFKFYYMELMSIQTDLLFRLHPLCNNLLKVRLNHRDYYLSKRRLRLCHYFDRFIANSEINLDTTVNCTRCFELFVKLLTKDRFSITYTELLLLLHICIRLNVASEVKEFLKNIILINLKTNVTNNLCQHFNMTEISMYLGVENKMKFLYKDNRGFTKLNPQSFLFYQNVFGPHLTSLLTSKKSKSINLDRDIVEQTRRHLANKGFYKYVELFFFKMKNVENNKFTKLDECYNLVELCPMIKITSGRFLVDEMSKKFRNETKLATLIQKHVRRLLAKKKLFQMNKKTIENKIKHRVTQIQTVVRSFLILKAIKKFCLINKIINDRKIAALKVTSFIKSFFVKKKMNVIYLLDKIITTRHEALQALQRTFRSYIFRTKINKILFKEKNYYSLTYPFKAKSVLLKIFISEGKDIKEQFYKFTYCPVRQLWVLYINPAKLTPGKYRGLLIVDGIITCDGRYPHIEFSDGHYYNIIDFNINNKSTPLQLTDHTDDTKNNTSIDNNKRDSKGTSFDSDASFMLNRGERYGSFDKNLVKNLADKEACSYLEIIKDSIREEFHDDYNY